MAKPYKILRDLLRENDITYDVLRDELDIGTDTISRKMNARSPWTSDQMYAILDLVGAKEESLHKIFPRNGQSDPEAIKEFKRKRLARIS